MADRIPPSTRLWRRLAFTGSAVCCVAISICYLIQPDWLAPVTLVPPYCWLILGLLLATCGYRRDQILRFFLVLAFWGVFTVVFVEQSRCLIRIKSRPTVEWQAAREHARGIRVVSLNCNVGHPRSVEEVAVWNPDVVLLQESPGGEVLGSLSKTLFGAEGAFLYGGDASILARGQLKPKLANPASHFVHAELKLPTGFTIDVVSIRLAPPVFRLDFWEPGFWIDHRDRRIEHREQILEVMEHVQSIPVSSHLIVGGDFNSPPYDSALTPLRARLFDTFSTAGRGWGATGTNDYPFIRVDQIWVSRGFRSDYVTAQKTLYSDHRIVVCDLIIENVNANSPN